jgi:hypothetical protein
VLKFWLCNSHWAVAGFGDTQKSLIAWIGVLWSNLIKSVVMFMKPVVIYDCTTDTPFDTRRGKEAILADRCRDDIAGPPVA